MDNVCNILIKIALFVNSVIGYSNYDVFRNRHKLDNDYHYSEDSEYPTYSYYSNERDSYETSYDYYSEEDLYQQFVSSHKKDPAQKKLPLIKHQMGQETGSMQKTAGTLAKPTGAASVPGKSIIYQFLLSALAIQMSFAGSWNKLLVTSGSYFDAQYVNVVESEVIDLQNPSANCDSLADSPVLTQAVGGLMNGAIPILCGGSTDPSNMVTSTYSDKCYSLGNPNPLVTLTRARFGSAAIMLDNGALWVTGGIDGTGFVTKSTEFVNLAGSTPGPDLPMARDKHCICKYDDTSVIIIGGDTAILTSVVYNFATGSWTNGPTLVTGRRDAICGLIKDTVDSSPILVVTGGQEGNYYVKTEIHVVGSNFFSNGPVFNVEITRHFGVVTDDGSSLVVGAGSFYDYDYYDGNNYGNEQFGLFPRLYKLSCASQVCTWTQMEQTVKTHRDDGVAMLIPDNMASCM